VYYLNKLVGAVLNPLGIGLLLMLAAIGVQMFRRSGVQLVRCSRLLLLLAFFWLWFWSTGAVGCWIGLSLEREFPPQTAEALPSADAIFVLGGGMAVATNGCPYADMQDAADRAWQGARLYKAGKAPKVFVTSAADAELMVDLGVPREAITVNDKARNTEEEARFISTTTTTDYNLRAKPKVLLVTSAWHMRRAKLMFERYAKGMEVVPAAADHMCTNAFARPLEFKDFIPDSVMLGRNAYLFKEIIGYYGYRFLRK